MMNKDEAVQKLATVGRLSIVTLVVLCLQLGYDVEECLTIAYNDIKDRQGVMIDDNFIKTKTRQPVNDTDDSTTSIASN
jgi:hypothetical protein|nr:MAG: MazG-like family protein [Bacteriophage sp.]